jgi:hypothetical protein
MEGKRMRTVAGLARWLAALGAIPIAIAPAALAFDVFHSPADNGVSGGIAPLAEGANALKVWVSNGTTPTTSGVVCVNGNGAEVCGWDLKTECIGACTFTGFDPGGADVVWNIEPGQKIFDSNGGNPINPTPAPERQGMLTVNVTGPAEVKVTGDQWVGAALGSNVPAVITIASAVDSDGDTKVDASDNCPTLPNPGWADSGTIGGTAPDGIGDVCQCGDVNGSGIVTGSDGLRINQAALNIGPFSATAGATQSITTATNTFLVGRCNVNNPDPANACTSADGLRVNQAALELLPPSVPGVPTKFKGFCPGQVWP